MWSEASKNCLDLKVGPSGVNSNFFWLWTKDFSLRNKLGNLWARFPCSRTNNFFSWRCSHNTEEGLSQKRLNLTLLWVFSAFYLSPFLFNSISTHDLVRATSLTSMQGVGVDRHLVTAHGLLNKFRELGGWELWSAGHQFPRGWEIRLSLNSLRQTTASLCIEWSE